MEIMEYYELFMKVMLKEVAKFKIKIDKFPKNHIAKLRPELNVNFVSANSRCAFMYRYATVLTYLFNDCIKAFFLSYSHMKDIFSLWKHYSSVKIISLSEGPGLDFIGFMLAVLEYDSSPPNFEVRVLAKNKAWRHTKNLISKVLNDPLSGSEFSKKPLQYQNLIVGKSDFKKNYSFGNVTANSEADVIFMMKTLNLFAPSFHKGRLVHMFKEFVASLKPEAIIFCFDTEPSIAVLTHAIKYFPGKFLYGPRLHTAQLQATFPEFKGNSPVSFARGMFFVWQKSPDTESKVNVIRVDNSLNKPNASSVENVSNTNVKDGVNLNRPWMESKLGEASIDTESKVNVIRVDNSLNKPNASAVEDVSNTDVKDNRPWMELKLEDASIDTESKVKVMRVDNSLNKSSASSVENVSNTDVNDSGDLNRPWMESKLFW